MTDWVTEIVRLAVAVSGSKFEVKLETLEQLEMAEVVEEAAAVDQLPDQCPVIGKSILRAILLKET